ncbi:MAG: ROK family protein [Bacilli bacterium]|nr:ROK family protein [Bacilli bacterium]MDD4065983.1 ROK family protein [Bacilli bacterium]
MKYAVAFDIGATNIRGAIISEYGSIFKAIKRKIGKVNSQEELVNQIVGIYQELDAEKFAPVGLGIGICGPVFPWDGFVYVLPNLGLENIPLKKLVEEKIKIPTFVSNDANVAALAEAKLGSGINYKIVQFLTVSTGIGGGLIINGKIIEGRDGYAQEVGHMIISKESKFKQSAATNSGSWESLCSGTSLQHQAEVAGLKNCDAKKLFELEQSGNEVAKKIVDEWIINMGIALANINLYIEPNIYVFGGGVSHSMDPYVDRIIDEVSKHSMIGARGKIHFAKSRLGSDSGLVGAALQAFYLASK